MKMITKPLISFYFPLYDFQKGSVRVEMTYNNYY